MELRLGNLRIRIDFGFPTMLALVLLASDRDLLLQILAVCLLHECGHGIAIYLTKAGLREIRLCGTGMQLRTETAVLSRAAQNAIYLAGPAANLLCAALLCKAAPLMALLHLCMGSFNLLPFRCLDGGAALDCLLHGRTRPVTMLCLLLAAGLCVLLLLYHIANPLLYMMLGYLVISDLVPEGGTIVHRLKQHKAPPR